ncbi:MAG: glycosyltransferase [Oligoflexia bacterium]|nr:glycosyltransferase [Oligoflexia bacterium]
MRVCILTRGDLFPANHGAAVKIVRTAQGLVRHGVQTFIVTDDRDHYLQVDRDGAHPVPYPARLRAAQEWPPLPRLGRLAHRLCDIVGYPQEEHFLYTPIFDPAWWVRAMAVGYLHDIDWFQAEFPGYGAPALVAARTLGLLRARTGRSPPKASIVQHNVEWDRLAEFGHDVTRVRKVEQALLALVDDVIAVSSDDRRRMVAAGTDPAKITVIPHGVDVETFAGSTAKGAGADVRQRHSIDASAPVLFFHGTLHYWPNTEAVRFIAEQLLPRLAHRPDLRVLIAGLSPPTYYAHPAIVFTGPVDDLAAHIAAADLCLCPIESGGGTRMKLLEYMAAGKATVSTTKGAEGIAFTPGVQLEIADGADAMAHTVDALIDDPPRRERLGRAAQTFARRLDWSAITGAYVDLYEARHRGEDWYERLLCNDVDMHLGPRQPGKPLTLLLLINRGCNLRCAFCDLWQDHIHMPVAERVLPLLDDAVSIGTKTLVITGGEPFLHPDLFVAVAQAKARGLSVNITTNGTRLFKRWDECRTSGVDSLSFSIDGLEATHDRLRGQSGAWRKTMAALDRVLADGSMAASVYFTATCDNVHELISVYDDVTARGARFDFWPVNDAPNLALRTPAQQAAWREAVAHIAAREPAVQGRLAFYRDSLAYHQGDLDGVPLRCLGLVDQYGVTYDGDLLPCCVWGGDGLRVGNVFETPLRTLWWSEPVQAARKRLFNEGCTAGCFNHSLYEFTESTGLPSRVDRLVGSAKDRRLDGLACR